MPGEQFSLVLPTELPRNISATLDGVVAKIKLLGHDDFDGQAAIIQELNTIQNQVNELGNPHLDKTALKDKIQQFVDTVQAIFEAWQSEKTSVEWQPPIIPDREFIINRLMTASNILWLLRYTQIGYAPTGGQISDLKKGLVPEQIQEHSKFRQALYDNRVALGYTA